MPQLAPVHPAATTGHPSSGPPSSGARPSGAGTPGRRPSTARPSAARPSRAAATRRAAPRRAASVLAGLLVSAVLVVTGGGAASAHDEVLSTQPAADAVVDQVPGEVSLQLSAPALATGTVLAVLAPDGTDLVDGPPVLVDDTVTQPLVADRPAGTYTVQWRITSADGHPVSGSWTFQASAATAAPAPSGTASSSESATPSASSPEPEMTTYASPGSETPSPSGSEGAAATTDDAGEGSGDSSGTAWGLLAGVAAVAVLVAGGVALARRRGRD